MAEPAELGDAALLLAAGLGPLGAFTPLSANAVNDGTFRAAPFQHPWFICPQHSLEGLRSLSPDRKQLAKSLPHKPLARGKAGLVQNEKVPGRGLISAEMLENWGGGEGGRYFSIEQSKKKKKKKLVFPTVIFFRNGYEHF